MAYKRILTVQDISCVGQCSMTVALPVLSACGHEVCILPSAVLSSHTGGFQEPAITDLTDRMAAIREHWFREKIDFDIIYTGYLGSVQAVREVEQILDVLLAPGGTVIVDPAMADHGKLYKGFDEAYAEAMRSLCARADVVLPNITEAAMMAGIDFRRQYDCDYIHRLLEQQPCKNVLLTGVGFENGQTGFALYSGGNVMFAHHERLENSYHGTGDLFASAFVGALASGFDAFDAGKIASRFTLKSIQNTAAEPAHWYGVKFEPALADLIDMLNKK